MGEALGSIPSIVGKKNMQLREYTKSHQNVYFKWANYMICGLNLNKAVFKISKVSKAKGDPFPVEISPVIGSKKKILKVL